MARFNTADPIPLSYVRIRQGALTTGLSVTVRVVNSLTGSQLLAITTMTEVTPGFYSYLWSHALTSFTDCMAIYTVNGSSKAENFQVDETLDKQESLSGRAT